MRGLLLLLLYLSGCSSVSTFKLNHCYLSKKNNFTVKIVYIGKDFVLGTKKDNFVMFDSLMVPPTIERVSCDE